MDQTDKKKIFAVGDIHGCHDKLLSLLQRLPIDKERDTIVFLGDYINRGPDSKQVLDTLIEIKQTYANPVFLKGNHEQLLLSYADTGDVDIVPFLRIMGIDATTESYGARVRDLRDLACFPPAHREFLRNLDFCYIAGKLVFTHADVPDSLIKNVNKGEAITPPDSREERDLLASRRLIEEKDAITGVTVIFGHSRFALPLVLPDRLCIDTGAAYGNILTAVELPGRKFYHA